MPLVDSMYMYLYCRHVHVLLLQESTISEQSSELSKLKGEVSSLNIKLKWAQNKLKSESEGHKVSVIQKGTDLYYHLLVDNIYDKQMLHCIPLVHRNYITLPILITTIRQVVVFTIVSFIHSLFY